MFARLLLVLALLVTGPALAVNPDEVLDDPALEERARALSTNLRCLVCQNQTIDDSDAPLARDLRVLVRERLVEGDTDDEVIDFVVARYGEFVLMTPRMGTHTLILWFTAPALLLVTGAAFAVWAMRRRKVAIAKPAALDPEEEKRLEAILSQNEQS